MKSKKVRLCTLFMSIILLFCAVSASAATPTDDYSLKTDSSLQSRSGVELLVSGQFNNHQGSSKTFYCAGGTAKAFYITFFGDSTEYVNFTVYCGSKDVWNASFKADEKMHSKTYLLLPAGNYHIDFSTASNETITYAMSWSN